MQRIAQYLLPAFLGVFVMMVIWASALNTAMAVPRLGAINNSFSSLTSRLSNSPYYNGFVNYSGIVKRAGFIGLRGTNFALKTAPANLTDEERKNLVTELVEGYLKYDLAFSAGHFGSLLLKKMLTDDAFLSASQLMGFQRGRLMSTMMPVSIPSSPSLVLKSHVEKLNLSLPEGKFTLPKAESFVDQIFDTNSAIYHQLAYQLADASGFDGIGINAGGSRVYNLNDGRIMTGRELIIDAYQNPLSKELQEVFLDSSVATPEQLKNARSVLYAQTLDRAEEMAVLSKIINNPAVSDDIKAIARIIHADPLAKLKESSKFHALMTGKTSGVINATEDLIRSLPDTEPLKIAYHRNLKAHGINPASGGRLLSTVNNMTSVIGAIADAYAIVVVSLDLVNSIKAGDAIAISSAALDIGSSVMGLTALGLGLTGFSSLAVVAGGVSFVFGMVAFLIVVVTTGMAVARQRVEVKDVANFRVQASSSLKKSIDMHNKLSDSIVEQMKVSRASFQDQKKKVATLFQNVLSAIVKKSHADDVNLESGSAAERMDWKHTIIMNGALNNLKLYADSIPTSLVFDVDIIDPLSKYADVHGVVSGDVFGLNTFKTFFPEGYGSFDLDLNYSCNKITENNEKYSMCLAGQPAPPLRYDDGTSSDIMYPYIIYNNKAIEKERYEIKLTTNSIFDYDMFWYEMLKFGNTAQPAVPAINFNTKRGDTVDAVVLGDMSSMAPNDNATINTYGGDDFAYLSGLIGHQMMINDHVMKTHAPQLLIDLGEGIDQFSAETFLPARTLRGDQYKRKAAGVFFDATRNSHNLGAFLPRVQHSDLDPTSDTGDVQIFGSLSNVEQFVGSRYLDVIMLGNNIVSFKPEGKAHYIVDLESTSGHVGTIIHNSDDWGVIQIHGDYDNVSWNAAQDDNGLTRGGTLDIYSKDGQLRQVTVFSENIEKLELYLSELQYGQNSNGTGHSIDLMPGGADKTSLSYMTTDGQVRSINKEDGFQSLAQPSQNFTKATLPDTVFSYGGYDRVKNSSVITGQSARTPSNTIYADFSNELSYSASENQWLTLISAEQIRLAELEIYNTTGNKIPLTGAASMSSSSTAGNAIDGDLNTVAVSGGGSGSIFRLPLGQIDGAISRLKFHSKQYGDLSRFHVLLTNFDTAGMGLQDILQRRSETEQVSAKAVLGPVNDQLEVSISDLKNDFSNYNDFEDMPEFWVAVRGSEQFSEIQVGSNPNQQGLTPELLRNKPSTDPRGNDGNVYSEAFVHNGWSGYLGLVDRSDIKSIDIRLETHLAAFVKSFGPSDSRYVSKWNNFSLYLTSFDPAGISKSRLDNMTGVYAYHQTTPVPVESNISRAPGHAQLVVDINQFKLTSGSNDFSVKESATISSAYHVQALENSPDLVAQYLAEYENLTIELPSDFFKWTGHYFDNLVLPETTEEGRVVNFSFPENLEETVQVHLNGVSWQIDTAGLHTFTFNNGKWYSPRDTSLSINTNVDLRRLDNNAEALRRYIDRYETVNVTTSNGNYVGNVLLPDAVPEGSIVKIVVNSSWGVNVRYNGDASLRVNQGGSRTFRYNGQVWELLSAVPKRWVTIKTKDKNYLQLAEVEVFNAARQNMAKGKVAKQANTGWKGVPSRAVDGNTNGAWQGGSVSHTLLNAESWWSVELGKSEPVDSIKVWNRSDAGYESRLSNFYVLITDFDPSGKPLSDLLNKPGTRYYYHPGVAARETVIQKADFTSKRWVTIKTKDKNYLQLAEVEVFNAARQNMAKGKVAKQANTGWKGVPSRAVDGNTNGAWQGGSVSHTLLNAESWWSVELGESEPVDSIKVWNRSDAGYESRLSNFYVLITDFDPSGKPLSDLLNKPGTRYYYHPGVAARESIFKIADFF